MIFCEKTYLPTDFAAYLLQRYAGNTAAEWTAFLNEDAVRSAEVRQIPLFLCNGKRYYDICDVFLFISRRDFEDYLTQHTRKYEGYRHVPFIAYAKLGFDASKPKEFEFVELVIGESQKLKMTPDEARELAAHLCDQADFAVCQEFEESEYLDCNETAKDSMNSKLIAMGLTDPDTAFEKSRGVA